MKREIDFYKPLPFFVVVSLALTLGGVALFFTKGFKLGTDFTGGIEMTVTFAKTVSPTELSEKLKVAGDRVEVQPVLTKPNRFFVRAPVTPGAEAGATERLQTEIKNAFGDRDPAFEASRAVSGTVSGENKKNAAWVTLWAVLAIGVYMAFRFKSQYAVGAIIAVLHDVIVMFAAVSLFGVEVSILTVTAALTILGYSVNDTIVLFDRVREHVRDKTHSDFRALINRSINEVFTRTMIMTFVTLSTVVVLWVFSVGGLRDFAFALFVGMLSGTYSSIYVASAWLIFAERRKKRPA